MMTGLLQAVYCLLTRAAHYQAFLAGFISSVGSFVLAGKPMDWLVNQSVIK